MLSVGFVKVPHLISFISNILIKNMKGLLLLITVLAYCQTNIKYI